MILSDYTQIHRTKNCGIAEINGLSSADSPLHALHSLHKQLLRGITWPPAPDPKEVPKGVFFPFVTFTGVVPKPEDKRPNNYGQKFADYITANDLGTITTVAPKRNWTSNLIQIWIWEPNYPNLWKHLKETDDTPVEVPVPVTVTVPVTAPSL